MNQDQNQNHNQTSGLFEIIKTLEKQYSDRLKKKLDLEFLVRVITRLDSFSQDCHACRELLQQLSLMLTKMADHPDLFSKEDHKQYQSLLSQIKNHLFKTHKLVTDGYYTNIYMVLGMSLGLVFGLTIFDNLALGLPIGLVIGLAVGSAQDADAKKKDRVI